MAIILATLPFVPLNLAEASTNDVLVLLLTPFVDDAFFEPVKKGMQDASRVMGVHATFDGTKDGNVGRWQRRSREPSMPDTTESRST